MGPFEVFTDRDKDQARSTLNHLEQLRWAFAYFTGKQEPKSLFPIRIVITDKPASPKFVPVGDAWRGFLAHKEDIGPEWNTQVVRILMDENLGRMPSAIEDGLIQLLSTAEVSGTHVIIGQPPKELTLNWARLHLLATTDEYRGRVRLLIANLEKGVDTDVAFRNALSKTAAEIDREAETHLNGKTVATYDLSGKPLNANRDFTPRVPDEDAVRAARGATSGPQTAMGLFDAGNFEAASKLQPEWSAPYRAMATTETDAGKKGGLVKKAAELAPRDSGLWTEFALLMTQYERWADADKAWAQALRAATDPADREEILARRRDLTDRRLEAEANARREAKLAEEREIQQLKNEAVARIQEAEKKANSGGALDPNAKVHEWWDGPQPDAKLAGTLTRVDCRAGKFTLSIRSEGKAVSLAVADPKALVVTGGGQTTLSCGAQKPARPVEVEYFEKSKQAAVIRFQ